MRWITTGTWLTHLDEKSTSKIRIRRAVRRPATYTEHDLISNDFTPDDGTFGDQLQLNEAFYQAINLVDNLIVGTFLMQTDVTIVKPGSSSSSAPPAVQSDEPHDEFMVCPPCTPPNPRPPKLGHCTYISDDGTGFMWCGEPCVRIHDPDYLHRGECRCELHARNRYLGK